MRKTLIYIPLFLMTILSACSERVDNAKSEATLPEIFPEYVGVTIPVGIAPLNFCMADRSVRIVDAVVTDSHGNKLHGQGVETTGFDIDEWHKLLEQNAGDSIVVNVSAKYDDGWHSYKPFSIYVSRDEMDYGVVYRRLEPGYEVYSKMGIYERDLSTFDETALIENTQFSGCVNCHSFNRCSPTNMSLHIRGKHGATLLRLDGNMAAYNTAKSGNLGSCVYPYWHPDGRFIIYSTNVTQQVFHVCDSNRIEVYDQASDLLLYDTEKNELTKCPLIAKDSIMETFPAFSADGKKLFFVQATELPADSRELQQIRYNLCSISFDTATGTFGDKVDTLFMAETLNQSVTMPRPSYDGRFLMFTLADYGQFPIWHHEADLYMVPIGDLQKPIDDIEQYRMRAVNSDDTESFHNWSSNSRWIVFSSRRDDGLFTRLYFSHIDEEGNDSKPFLLPQANPRRYYDELFMSYNVPDFVTTEVNFDDVRAESLINSPERIPMK
ncbi:MAG: PD40 domain-containing protein [Marinilabiliaceae bacterium]|nr:PD40 domain-containing protein [Marinilabiliaceae bacterium]